MQHDIYGTFPLDMTKAIGGSSADPFLASVATTASTGPTSGTSSGGSTVVSAASVPLSSAKATKQPSGISQFQHSAVDIHGKVMGAVFLGVFPVTALAIRAFSFPNLIWYHAALQLTAVAATFFAAGLGVWASRTSYPVSISYIKLMLTNIVIQPATFLLWSLHLRLVSAPASSWPSAPPSFQKIGTPNSMESCSHLVWTNAHVPRCHQWTGWSQLIR
jgi:hypothetical protein